MDNIETHGDKATYAGRGEPAWHRLGTTFPADQQVSAMQMLELAHLAGWNVRTEPLTVTPSVLSGLDADGNPVYLPGDTIPGPDGLRAIVRDNPFTSEPEALAVVGSRYEIRSNEDNALWADGILDGGALPDTAGSIDGGRRVFFSLTIDKDVVLDPSGVADTVKTYLLTAWSHDGTLPTTALLTPTRVVCQNTLNYALGKSDTKLAVRHTKTQADRLAQARQVLGLTFKHMDLFEQEAEALYRQSMTDNAFDKLIEAVWPKPDKPGAGLTRWANRRSELHAIRLGQADGPNTTEGIRDTWWGGMNVLTEYIDWYLPGRGDNAERNRLEQSARLSGDVTVAQKAKVRAAAIELAGV